MNSNNKITLAKVALHVLRKIGWLIPDLIYIRMTYYLVFKKKLNLKNPLTYNEKLQFLKIHDRNPLYTKLVDKHLAKEYVSNIIGNEYTIPTYGVWNKYEDINFEKIPEKFVIKCTNGSGGVLICKNRENFDFVKAGKFFSSQLRKNPFYVLREWPYKYVKNKIIIESFLVDESGTELKDYKFFCFNGEPKFFFIASERPHDTRFDFFDLDFNHLPFIQGHPIAEKTLIKPKNFDKMIEIAKRLSEGLIHVRVDLYNIDGKIYFGELTFYHFSGMVPFEPDEWDYKFGDFIDLKQINIS